MSSKRNKNHNVNTPASNQNAIPHHLSKKTEQFEEQQLQNLQSIINHLSNKVFITLGKQDAKLYSQDLGPLRIYAQYLNLYMKFKDKCFTIDEPKQQSPTPNPSKQTKKENTNEVAKSQTKSIQQKDSQSNKNTTPNRLHQTNSATALLMSPANGTNTDRHKT